jgi:hypothetical protein
VYSRVVSVNPPIYMRAAGPNWACALFHYLPHQRRFYVGMYLQAISILPFLHPISVWLFIIIELMDHIWVSLGCVRFWNVREWNGTVPFLGAVLVFGSGIEWNGLVPREGIFVRDAECTHPPKSAGRGGMEIRLIKFSYN